MSERRHKTYADIRRRDVIGYTAGAALVFAEALYRLRRPERYGEIGRSTWNMRLITGNHALPDGYGGHLNRDVNIPYSRGDLTVSAWPSSTLTMIDQRMRESKRKGVDNYVICLDGDQALIGDGEKINYLWPWLPHPNLMQEKAYPRTMYLVNTEPPTDNFLQGQAVFIDPLDTRAVAQQKELEKEIAHAYNLYTPDKKVDHFNAQVEEAAITLVALGTAALVAYGVRDSTVSRRGLVRGILGGAAVVQLAGVLDREGILAEIIGSQSGYRMQQFLTEAQSVTEQTNYGNYLDLWIKARTAMAVQKTVDARVEIAKTDMKRGSNPEDIPADLLYGSWHSVDAPEIMTSEKKRKQVIQGGSYEFLDRIDTAMQSDYPALARGQSNGLRYRDQILAAAMANITQYSFGNLNYSWGTRSPISPSRVYYYEQAMHGGGIQLTSPTLFPWGLEVLREFGIKQ